MRRDSLIQLPAALRPGARSPGGLDAEARGGLNRQARYVMGIDGGATKTLAAVLDLQTNALHYAQAGPSNEDAIGAQAAVSAVLEVADEALERAGIGERELAGAVLAVAGTDTDAIARQVGVARDESWIVVNDAVAAWAAATGAQPGIGAVSGTGSNVFGVGRDGRSWRVGGWGHLLGDEGSGYWFGLESIRAALHDRDGSGPATALSDAAVAFFGALSVEALAASVYAKPPAKSEIAAFATETARLAQRGDAVARQLYRRGAGELGAQIATVIAMTGLAVPAGKDGDGAATAETARPFPVGLIGSALKAGEVFVEPLTAVIEQTAPQARVSVVEMAPVGGSLLLAAQACGRTIQPDPDELSRLLDDCIGEPA